MWLAGVVDELKKYGCNKDEIKHHISQLYNFPTHVVDNAILVSDAKDKKVLED